MFALLPFIFPAQNQPIHLKVNPAHVLRTFDPELAFGAGIDGHEYGQCMEMLNKKAAQAMISVGLKPLTYRLRTELAGEVWHWNPKGTWSDPTKSQGYWTSSSKVDRPINLSYGYRLPRRGNTFDQANRDDYSRLVDGDDKSFWKSNPYLSPSYTHDSYETHPEWVVLRLDDRAEINQINITWATPYATQYRVEYWSGGADAMENNGQWLPFEGGIRKNTKGGREQIHVTPASTQYIRILLQTSSNTAPNGSKDPRDKMGFAIAEISAGTVDANGVFQDKIRHKKVATKQTQAFVSSTDPWHRKSDIDLKIEQPGFDLILKRGFDQNLPILMPVGGLYDTPDNVEAEMRWLKARGVRLAGIEIGEEPDGQWTDGDKYAALYIQMAKRVRKIDPKVPIGGPSFQTVQYDFREFPRVEKPWLTIFRDYLKKRNSNHLLQFASFEWYPFDDVLADPKDLLPRAPEMMAECVERLNAAGMKGLPWMITEYGWSAFGAKAEVDLPGAVFNFDCCLKALELGCKTSYLYGYEPNELIEEIKGGWGNNMIFLKTEDSFIRLPTFYSARLMARAFCSLKGKHALLEVQGKDRLIGSYAVRRPNGSLAVALLNRSPQPKTIALEGLGSKLTGWIYDRQSYVWKENGSEGRPLINKPPRKLNAKPGAITLPPYAIVVLTKAS